MKKTLILLAFIFVVATPSLAYYGYYDNEPSTFVSILYVIWGILCLIMFFKLWGATNDIDKLQAKFCSNSKLDINEVKRNVLVLHLQGKDEDAYNFLNQYFAEIAYEYWYSISNEKDGNELFKNKHQSRIKKLAPIYKAIGKEIPDSLLNLKFYDIYNFGK